MEEGGGFVRLRQSALCAKMLFITEAQGRWFSQELFGYMAASVRARMVIQYVSDVFLAKGGMGADISL